MRYDINLIHELCKEIRLSSRLDGDRCVEIDLGEGVTLYFQNHENENDCLMGFLDVAWHTHDNIMFTDARGHYIELDYLDVITGLKDGQVLICERLVNDKIVDRCLTHRDYNDEFKYVEKASVSLFAAPKPMREFIRSRACCVRTR